MVIRDETPADLPAIRVVHRAAFGRESEAGLVDRLRSDGLFIASLVAIEADEIVGHILFTRLQVEVDGRIVRAAALAPLAVIPKWQRRGVGSKLTVQGLAQLPAKAIAAVIVLGHPEYYPRFGFSPELTRKLVSPFRGKSSFMALELTAGALSGQTGTVTYPKAFGLEDRGAS